MSTQAPSTGIIVLGAPRSGTTLLRRLLDAHPNIACPGETHLFRACGRFLKSDRVAEGVQVGVLDGLAYAGFDEAEVFERLRRFVFAFHEDYAKKQGKTRWADKSPLDGFYIDDIDRLCGNAVQFICIQRHGLDVALSIKDLCEKNGGYLAELHDYVARYPLVLEAFAHAWVDITRAVDGFAKRHPQNAMLVRYEDLTADPNRTMGSVADFLGERWDSALTATALESQRHLGLGDWKTYGRAMIDQSSVARWKQLSRDTISRLGVICNPTLELCGYAPVAVQAERPPDEIRRRVEIGLMVQRMKKERAEPRSNKDGKPTTTTRGGGTRAKSRPTK